MKESIIQNTNDRLSEIFNNKSLTPEKRGELGEDVVFDLVKYWSSFYPGSFNERSLIFPQGKVLAVQGSAEKNPVTEIDILTVTPYRIFVLEVKTIYGHMRVFQSNNIEISKTKTFTGEYEKKNFLQQNEMHARHLYYHLHKLLPDGNPDYICPMIVMTGKMKFEDFRDPYARKKYPMTTTNGLVSTLKEHNVADKYLLDVAKIKKKLKEIKVNDRARLLNSQTFN